MFDAGKVKNACVQWIREFFENNGKDCKHTGQWFHRLSS